MDDYKILIDCRSHLYFWSQSHGLNAIGIVKTMKNDLLSMTLIGGWPHADRFENVSVAHMTLTQQNQ